MELMKDQVEVDELFVQTDNHLSNQLIGSKTSMYPYLLNVEEHVTGLYLHVY